MQSFEKKIRFCFHLAEMNEVPKYWETKPSPSNIPMKFHFEQEFQKFIYPSENLTPWLQASLYSSSPQVSKNLHAAVK